MSRLDQINGSADVRRIPVAGWRAFVPEIRRFLISHCAEPGGHFMNDLGIVELMAAMYLSFCPPEDKVTQDIGHQSYAHKILSGRKKDFVGLRQLGGTADFPKRSENPCGAFNTGHSSTSIPAELGMVTTQDPRDEYHAVISVVGDGALIGDMAYEVLNSIGRMKSNFIIVLNDNRMSISENMGDTSAYPNPTRISMGYNCLKENVVEALSTIPGLGKYMVESLRTTRNGIKQLFVLGVLSENLGVTYLGPVDGYDTKEMMHILEEARHLSRTALVHVIIEEGKGYRPAKQRPDLLYGVGPFEPVTGVPEKNKYYLDYTGVFSKTLIQSVAENPRIVAATATVPEGTGLAAFGWYYPQRYFDIGIAEQHAVASTVGPATGGVKSVIVVYSSFLQHGFDQVLHDVCIQNPPVVFVVNHAGLVGADSETHQGVLNSSYFGCIPNMTIFAPRNCWEFEKELRSALPYGGPIAIRYPCGQVYRSLEEHREPIRFDKAELLFRGERTALLALDNMVSMAEHIREKLKVLGQPYMFVSMRFVKPIGREPLAELAETH